MEKYSRYTQLKQFYKFIPKEKEKIQIVNVLLIPLVPWLITNTTKRMEYCWAFIITEQ